MPYSEFQSNETNLEKLSINGVSPDDDEEVVRRPDRTDFSRSSGRPMAFGEASDGRMIACVYEEIDEVVLHSITAFYVQPK